MAFFHGKFKMLALAAVGTLFMAALISKSIQVDGAWLWAIAVIAWMHVVIGIVSLIRVIKIGIPKEEQLYPSGWPKLIEQA